MGRAGPAGLATALMLALTTLAFAQEPLPPLPTLPEDEEPAVIDVVEATVSEQVRATAAQLDAFFGDSRFIDETNETELRVGAGIGVEDRRGVDIPLRLRGRLRLPLAEERLAIVLGRGEDVVRPVERGEERFDTDRERRDTSIGLRLALRDLDTENLGVTGGLRFSSGNPQVFIGPRYRRTWRNGRNGWFATTPTLDLRWFSRDGLAAGADVDFETATGQFTLLRLTPSIDWIQSEAGFDYGLALRLFQRLGEDRVLSYFATSSFRSRRPSGLDVASLGILYRQSVLRDWIFAEIQPAVMFRDSNDLDPTGRITGRIEFVFGGPR